jgi:hypothetical protein
MAVVYVKICFFSKLQHIKKKEKNEYLCAAAILSQGQIPDAHWKR